MKKIFNLMLSVSFVCIIIIIFYNKELIVTYAKRFFEKNKVVKLNATNEFTRNFEFEKFKYNKNSEDYNPKNYKDLENIYFNFLNNGYKEFTFFCKMDYQNCIEDIKTISGNNTLLSNINNYINPFNSFSNIKTKIGSDNSITLINDFLYSNEEINKTNTKIDNLIEQLDLNKLNNRDKIKKVHNYIIEHTKYDELMSETLKSNFKSNKAYGPLLEGYGICSGYSDAMALFLDKFKIPNIKITSEKHIWNLVKINNKWLHLDLTWDDPVKQIENETISYKFFLITTEELKKLDKKEHNFDEIFYTEIK